MQVFLWIPSYGASKKIIELACALGSEETESRIQEQKHVPTTSSIMVLLSASETEDGCMQQPSSLPSPHSQRKIGPYLSWSE
jgi:hypothetical protein